jgi:hypothetical protein
MVFVAYLGKNGVLLSSQEAYFVRESAAFPASRATAFVIKNDDVQQDALELASACLNSHITNICSRGLVRVSGERSARASEVEWPHSHVVFATCRILPTCAVQNATCDVSFSLAATALTSLCTV